VTARTPSAPHAAAQAGARAAVAQKRPVLIRVQTVDAPASAEKVRKPYHLSHGEVVTIPHQESGGRGRRRLPARCG